MSSQGEDKEPDFSDVVSGSSSSAPAPKGEAWSSAARRVVMSRLRPLARRNEIFEANKDTIKNPDLIHPGQVLKIPGA